MATDRFEGLTAKQTQVLGLIAENNDSGHSRHTLKVLMDGGYIETYRDRLPDRDSVPLFTTRYRVPSAVHIRYCEWASRQVTDHVAGPPADPDEMLLRHRLLHRALDELIACWIAQTGELPSEHTVMQLMEWSYQQTQEAICQHHTGDHRVEPT